MAKLCGLTRTAPILSRTELSARIVVLPLGRQLILLELHVWWPGLDNDLEAEVKQCNTSASQTQSFTSACASLGVA